MAAIWLALTLSCAWTNILVYLYSDSSAIVKQACVCILFLEPSCLADITQMSITNHYTISPKEKNTATTLFHLFSDIYNGQKDSPFTWPSCY